ncbi:MAG: LPS export ABC transporter periplasmic protein LptC [Burkholderiaceae bacterium]|nr:MAG: LPS export ABC transporter periplasmic protein LptC [Burkholderiaceae bacterium]
MLRERIIAVVALLLLAMLALGSYWLAQRARLGQPERVAAPAKHEPDYFAEQFLLHRLNTQGQIDYRLQAAHMVHYPDDNTSELSPKVFIERSATPRQAALQVVTDRAILDHDAELILSTDPVRATQGQSIMTGIGMRMDTAARTLQLDKDVRTTWVHP